MSKANRANLRRHLSWLSAPAVALLLSAQPLAAQENRASDPGETRSTTILSEAEPTRSGARPALRTAGAMLGSAAGYAIAESVAGGGPDDVLAPVAAGWIGGAIGSLLFTNAHPLQVILGSALAAVPAAAVASFVAGSMPDDRQLSIPLISFSLPHGLLTSALSQHRTPSAP